MFFTSRQNFVKFSAPHNRLRWLDLEECSMHPYMQIIHYTPQTQTTLHFEFENICT